MTRKDWTRVALVELAFMLLAGSLQAQMFPPFGLRAQVENGTNVKLSWSKPFLMDRDDIQYYKIYRGSSLSSFALLDSTRDVSYADTPPTGVSLFWFYYVTAVTRFGQSPRSNVVLADLSGQTGQLDRVQIISTPPTNASVGVPYAYQVVAVSRDSAAIRFYLGHGPAGMKIDSTSGMVQWTPITPGRFSVELFAVSSARGKAEQEFVIHVASGHAVVQGTVKDSTGAGVNRVLISLFQITRSHFSYEAVTDSTGAYNIENVDQGRYYARALPLKTQYLPQWYNGVRELRDATPIDVPDSGSVTINFVLKPFVPPALYTASGSVKDTSGAPITTAWVYIISKGMGFAGHMDAGADDGSWTKGDDWRNLADDMMDDMLNHMSGGLLGGIMGALGRHDDNGWNSGNAWSGEPTWNDLSFEQPSRFVTRTHVDSLGNFSVKVLGGSYIALATARGYVNQYYNHKTNFLEADTISVAGNVTGINFNLVKVSTSPGSISGRVIDSTTLSGVMARVLAFNNRGAILSPLDRSNAVRVYTTETDSTGTYTFSNLPPGDYIILAVPAGRYAPSFYSTKGITHFWKDAAPVTVSGNSVIGINIYVKPLPITTAGFTSINGQVVAGSTGISGALVYASLDGNLAAYALSDNGGRYAVSGLAPGTYLLAVDKPGYDPPSPATAAPTYTANGTPSPSSVDFTLSQSVLSVGNTETTPETYALEQNYPNPFNPTTQIAFVLPKTSHVELSAYNIIGQKIATLVSGVMDAGTHQVTWDASDNRGVSVPSGVYFYQLKAGDFTATRKMLLLR